MNNLTVFNNEEFGNLRSLEINGEPWFVGKEVAEILGYERPTKAVQDHVDNEDKDVIPIQDSIGRMQSTPIINESGLYTLILRSKLPKARDFKRWVTSEVLPSLRKTGSYSLNTEGLSETTKIVVAMSNALVQQDRRITQVEQKVDGAVEGLKTAVGAIKTEANWRKEIKDKIDQIVAAKGSTWEVEYPLLYRELEVRARCNLTARKRNRIHRILEQGLGKTQANKTRKIDVIEADPKLKEIFSKIVAENMMIYCI